MSVDAIVLAMVVLFTAYVVMARLVIGRVTYSISNTFYALPEHLRWTFWVFGFELGIGAMWIGQITQDWTYAVSGFLMCCVPVAAYYREKYIDLIHNIGAVGSITIACFGLVRAHEYPAFYVMAGGIVAARMYQRLLGIPNLTYWFEIWCFACLAYFLQHRY